MDRSVMADGRWVLSKLRNILDTFWKDQLKIVMFPKWNLERSGKDRR